MSQKAFAALVLFEIGVAVVSTSALYIFWWPSVLSTTAKATLYELSCIDEGVVPHYTMAEAVTFLETLLLLKVAPHLRENILRA